MTDERPDTLFTATQPTELRILRRVTLWSTAVYVVLLALIAFWATSVDGSVHDLLADRLELWRSQGAPEWLRYGAIEFAANVLLFVPLGVCMVVLLGARRWWLAIVSGGVLSVAIELTQLLFLPGRSASVRDVLANTAGTALGVTIGLLLVYGVARVAARRSAATRATSG